MTCGALRPWFLWTAVALLNGCAGFAPSPLEIPAELENVQTKSIGEVAVSVGILRDQQARFHFGADLARRDLQAVWIQIANESPRTLWFIRNLVDADFFPPDEAAFIVGGSLRSGAFERLRQYFRDESIRVMLPPHSTTEGFLFVPHQEGGRYVQVRLLLDALELERMRSLSADGSVHHDGGSQLSFGFSLPLPDGIFDYERLDTAHTYGDQVLPDLDLEQLRTRLERLPPCVTNASGGRNGDPLNLVIVGDSTDVLNSLSRSGWSFTHRITLGSIRRLIGATIGGGDYAVAPVSNLYLFGRKHDFALQRARKSVARRNHLRLWLAPFQHEGRQVWVGQVSRDIGIKLTTKSPSLTTHVIDPEVDLAREYLLHSLFAEGFVDSFGFVKGPPVAPMHAPAENLTGDPYFTDGMRLVVMLASQPRPYEEVRRLLWERSAAPVAEGQSPDPADGGRSGE